MSPLLKIEEDIKSLAEQACIKLRGCFQDYESQKWDKLVKTDIQNGKRDSLALFSFWKAYDEVQKILVCLKHR